MNWKRVFKSTEFYVAVVLLLLCMAVQIKSGQFFTGNNLAGKLPVDAGKDGRAFVFRGGFCLEPSRFPDSPNHPEYPSTSIKPGEFYTGCIEYRFSAR